MKVISVWNEKGGVGKSTIAFHLAGAAVAKGLSVLLIDKDAPQNSCYDMAQDGHVSFEVVTEQPETKPNVDIVVVDMAPGVEKLPRGHFIVFPYEPSRLAWSKARIHLPRLNQIGKVIRVISKVDTRKSAHQAMATKHKAAGAKQVTLWSVYENATNEGRTIFDPALNSADKISKARNEINLILDEVMK